MIKGIIFDLDGTLLYTLDDLTSAVNSAVKEYGIAAYTPEEIREKVGNGFRKLIERSMPSDTDEKTIDEVLSRFVFYYDKCYMDKSHPYEGVKELLTELNRKGILVAINSNKRDDYTKNIAKNLFAGITVFEAVGSREGIPNKPDPYTALEIASHMGFSKEEILFVGDGSTDIKTGLSAGFKTIGVTWGYREKTLLINCGAEYFVDKPIELLEYLED